MRLSEQHIAAIRDIVREEAGADAGVSVFGLRLRDDALGGDLDLTGGFAAGRGESRMAVGSDFHANQQNTRRMVCGRGVECL